MYEEWTYAISRSEPEKPTAQRSSGNGPGVNLQSAKRARRKSIVQTVALVQHHHEEVSEPPTAQPALRRARSLSRVDVRTKKDVSADEKSLTYDYPFTKQQEKTLQDTSQWIEDEADDIAWADDDVLLRAEDSQALELWHAGYAQVASCGKMLDEADKLIDILDRLSLGLKGVEDETVSFEKTCDSLVAREHWLDQLYQNIEAGLKVYDNLDRATRKLSAPGSEIVRKREFQTLLEDLDNGLKFTSEHTDFVDVDLYAMKYRQCMTRALSLCHDYFTSRVRMLQNSVTSEEAKRFDKQTGSVLGEATRQALLYGKFEDEAGILYPVADQIAQRIDGHAENLHLLVQCVRAFCAVRNRLLQPVLAQQAAETAMSKEQQQQQTNSRGRGDFVHTCVRSLGFYKDLFNKEAKLFGMYFNMEITRDELQNWLIDLSEPLHDGLRQRIIRETDVANLCELISVLLPYVDDHHDAVVNLPLLFNPVLKDVQYRLVFRTQQLIEYDIVRYVPQSDDLTQLGNRRKKSVVSHTSQTEIPPESDTSAITGDGQLEFDTEAIVEGWYPPLKTAVTILSQIYQLVNSSIFDDLAHHILHECIASLNKVFVLAQTRLGPMEAHLFLMKQLLILRAQIVEFDIDAAPAEVQVDFSGLAGVISRIRTEGVQINSSSILNLARESVPKVVNNMLDAKSELYAQLKNAIHAFTELAVKTITKSIIDNPLPSTAVEDTRKLRQDIQQELPRIRDVIKVYVADDHTVDILIDSIQDLVIQTYEAYHENIVATGSPAELDGVMEVDGLISWLSDVVSSIYRNDQQP